MALWMVWKKVRVMDATKVGWMGSPIVGGKVQLLVWQSLPQKLVRLWLAHFLTMVQSSPEWDVVLEQL